MRLLTSVKPPFQAVRYDFHNLKYLKLYNWDKIKEFENGETEKITLVELEEEAKQRASRIA